MEWIKTSEKLPTEGERVETKVDDKDGTRNFQDLVYKGNLWWTPNMSMYVYYSPSHWRKPEPLKDSK